MKKIIFTLVVIFLVFNLQAAISYDWSAAYAHKKEISALPTQVKKMSAEDFVSLTPERYKEVTGKKLGLFGKAKLKAAQKIVRSNGMDATQDGGGINKGLYIALSIFFLGWLAMGILDNWSGNNWIIDLLLYFLVWLPGFIFAMIKMGDYF